MNHTSIHLSFILEDIKYTCDLLHNVTNLCVDCNTINKLHHDSTLTNILLKINAKLGGTHTVCGPDGRFTDLVVRSFLYVYIRNRKCSFFSTFLKEKK